MNAEKLEEEKIILEELKLSALDLRKYTEEINQKGGLEAIDRMHEHAICDCIYRIGDGVKRLTMLLYKDEIQKKWTGLKVVTAHKYEKPDLSKVWDVLPDASEEFIRETEDLLSKATTVDRL